MASKQLQKPKGKILIKPKQKEKEKEKERRIQLAGEYYYKICEGSKIECGKLYNQEIVQGYQILDAQDYNIDIKQTQQCLYSRYILKLRQELHLLLNMEKKIYISPFNYLTDEIIKQRYKDQQQVQYGNLNQFEHIIYPTSIGVTIFSRNNNSFSQIVKSLDHRGELIKCKYQLHVVNQTKCLKNQIDINPQLWLVQPKALYCYLTLKWIYKIKQNSLDHPGFEFSGETIAKFEDQVYKVVFLNRSVWDFI